MAHVRVFIACSLDGFIAGPNDELDWLPDHGAGAEDTFTPFMNQVGALLMGRRTYEAIKDFSDPWPYGDKPILVATRRTFDSTRPTVSSISGAINTMIDAAKRIADARDVYIDGGALIRSAIDASLVDEMIVTMVPKILGAGVPLFAGVTQPVDLRLMESREIGAGMVQLRYALNT